MEHQTRKKNYVENGATIRPLIITIILDFESWQNKPEPCFAGVGVKIIGQKSAMVSNY